MLQTYELMHKVIEWWDCAGKEAREQFLQEVTSRKCTPCWMEPYHSANKKPDLTYTVDFRNDYSKLGNKLVYIYSSENGIPYYVGMGGMDRPINIISRSEKFKEQFSKCNYSKVYIIATRLHEGYADEVETLCIQYLLRKGWKLVNVKKMDTTEDVFQMLVEDYPTVVSKLDKFNKDCLSEVLNNQSRFNECIVRNSNKDQRYRSKNIWEIDGKIKTATVWCKEYGCSVSQALQRIVTFGCTPKEALTFPKKTNWSYRTCEAFWENQGLIPGTDTTSRVISLNSGGKSWVDLNALLSDDESPVEPPKKSKRIKLR